ncbi:DUF1801 domain-containing protein [Jiulongibacter sp. NS-SX5]|uniref:DUF1801 domain-containing protein n=1 Tax=Jiulongibacter sp. NS-SX5 TaxID=3463854 RepID=UPI004059BFD3
MAKADLKTKENDASVDEFLNAVDHEVKRKDAFHVKEMMESITGLPPKMWGPSIIGFGSYHYKYDSGREGDMLKVGFSPRKTALTLYIMPGFDRYEELMAKLGKYKTGKSCLYIKRLADVDEEILKELIKGSWDYMTNKYG